MCSRCLCSIALSAHTQHTSTPCRAPHRQQQQCSYYHAFSLYALIPSEPSSASSMSSSSESYSSSISSTRPSSSSNWKSYMKTFRGCRAALYRESGHWLCWLLPQSTGSLQAHPLLHLDVEPFSLDRRPLALKLMSDGLLLESRHRLSLGGR